MGCDNDDDNVWRHADCSTKPNFCETLSASEFGAKYAPEVLKIQHGSGAEDKVGPA